MAFVNTSPLSDVIGEEELRNGGDKMFENLNRLICHPWRSEEVPIDWINTILNSLYKSRPNALLCKFRSILL